MNVNERAAEKLAAARSAMILDEPFWGILSLRLQLRADPTCNTAWVDGRTLGYNPSFIDGLTHSECIALVVHETKHCVFGHPWRRGARDPERWNEAADRVINPLMRDAGYKLPAGALYELDRSHLGKPTEWVYERLSSGDGQQQQQQQQQRGAQSQGAGAAGPTGEQQSDGQGGGDPLPQQQRPNPLGEVRDAPADCSADNNTEEDWRQAVQQAYRQAEARGQGGGMIERVVKEATRVPVDWRSLLMAWAQERARADYTWARPNPRYLPMGIYLPSLRSTEVGDLVLINDTSASVDEITTGQVQEQLREIADTVRPRRIIVVYADAMVQDVEVFEQGDQILLHPKGGGGTDFRPALQYVEQMDEPPVGVIYMTDLDGPFPERAPSVPVLWAATEDRPVPFGEKVLIQ